MVDEFFVVLLESFRLDDVETLCLFCLLVEVQRVGEAHILFFLACGGLSVVVG